MKNDWKEFMEHINKTSPVPNHIWDHVKPHIPKAKNENGFLVIWYSSIFLFLGSIYYLSDNKIRNTNNILNVENHTGNQDINLQMSKDETAKKVSHQVNNTISSIAANLFSTQQHLKKSITPVNPDLIQKLKREDQSDNISEAQDASVNNLAIQGRELVNIKNLTSSASFHYSFNINTIRLPNRNDCYTFSKRPKNHFFIETYAGPEFSPFKLSAANAEFAENVNFRNSSESSHLSITGGIRLGMQIGKFSARIGGEIHSIYEKLHFQNNSDTDIIEVFKNSNLIRRDTIFGVRTIKIHNFHNLLNLPISLGYDFAVGNHHIIPQVGLSFNILARHKGALLDTLYRPQYFTTGRIPSNEIYKTQIGLSTFINIQYLVPVASRISFYIEPSMEIFHSEFNKPAYPINQKYIAYKCNLGLRYNLF